MWTEIALAVMNILQLALILGIRFYMDTQMGEILDLRRQLLDARRELERVPKTSE